MCGDDFKFSGLNVNCFHQAQPNIQMSLLSSPIPAQVHLA